MELAHLFSKEQKMLRRSLREFVDKEIMPVREALETDSDLVATVHQKLVDLGVQGGGYPPEYGGTGPYESCVEIAILLEELSRGDGGIAVSAMTNAGALGLAMIAENKAVVDRFAPDFCGEKANFFCWAMTDTSGGCDTENPLLKGRGITTRALLEGDEWVINGSKSWPTNAGIASLYLVICSTDPAAGEEGIAQIFVPGDTPGLSFGKPEAKVGFKTCTNASIYFDNVRVPKEYRLAGPGDDARFFMADAMALGQWMNATQSLGIAQGAFDIALEYTKNRKSGGRPVRNWSLVAGILADMAARLEMMRGGVYNYAVMLDTHEHYGPPFQKKMIARANALRIYSAEACEFIVNRAMELLGANGLSPEYHLEKYYRDAAITRIVLGGQQVSKYRVAMGYYNYELN
jgi:alkylation response protein AidB-like acyl-CoA dehydrogenase